MTEEHTVARRSLWKHILRPLIGVSLLTCLIVVIGPRDVLSSVQKLDIHWLGLGVAAILLSTLMGAFNLFLIINSAAKIGFSTFLKGYWIAWAVGLVVPGQVGDVLGISLWMRRHGFNWERTSGIAIIDKLITLVWMGALAVFGLRLVLPHIHLNIQWVVIVGLIGVLLTGLLVFSLRDRILARFPSLRRFTSEFYDTLQSSRSEITLNVFLTPLKIALIGIAYWSVLRAAGVVGLDIGTTILLVAISSLVTYIPISFNGIGTAELAAVAIFGVYHVAPASVLSVFITLRILVFILAWIPAGIVLALPEESAH